MNPDRWQRIERLYHAALVLPGRERAAFLTEACAGDKALRREGQALLDSPAMAQRFLTAPALARGHRW